MSDGRHRHVRRWPALIVSVSALALIGVASIAAGFVSEEDSPPAHVPLPPASSSQTSTATSSRLATSESPTTRHSDAATSDGTRDATSPTVEISATGEAAAGGARSSQHKKGPTPPGTKDGSPAISQRNTELSPTSRSASAVGGTVSIPALGVSHTTIGPTCAVSDGVLEPPTNHQGMLCHWSGSTIDHMYTIAGHINYSGFGQGALGRLYDLRPGDRITTSIGGHRQSWAVTKVWSRPKSQGVDTAVFAGGAGPKRLALVTCGGTLHSGNYDHNIYALASPA